MAMARTWFTLLVSIVAWLWPGASHPNRAQAADGPCGEVVSLTTHGDTTTRYALARPDPAPARPVALVLLAGGGGFIDLDDGGCPRGLTGNSLVRSASLFRAAGFITALLDAPSDHPGEDGLAGFRIDAAHAEDLGTIIADVRGRTRGAVWVLGTSRGSISAANAAARLSGDAAPDGVVLTSALMVGDRGAKKKWVAQTVFDLPLEAIRIPLLVVGHRADRCPRSPADHMDRLAERVGSARKHVVTLSGGPGWSGGSGLEACAGKAPHGFAEQEDELVQGIARFIGGGRF